MVWDLVESIVYSLNAEITWKCVVEHEYNIGIFCAIKTKELEIYIYILKYNFFK